MDRFPRLLRAFFVGTLVSLAACSNGDTKSSEKQLSFPASAAKDTDHRTAIVPKDVTADMAPMPDEQDDVVAIEVPAEILPVTFADFMQHGRKHFSDGEMGKALALFEEAVGKRPESAGANLQLARTLLAMGEGERAREYAETAIELDTGSSLAWNTLGRVELAERNHDAAIVSFERAVLENEDNSYAWNNLGFLYIEIADYQAAAEALEQATSGSAPTSYMWNNLGMAYEHLDQIVEARAAYRQAADAGSAKARANVERLEGVVSLIPSSDSPGPEDSLEAVDGADEVVN